MNISALLEADEDWLVDELEAAWRAAQDRADQAQDVLAFSAVD
jgi:hypothetical protein